MKAPDWWVKRIRHLFGADGLPVYVVSDSPPLAAKVVSALRRLRPPIYAHSRVNKAALHGELKIDQPLSTSALAAGGGCVRAASVAIPCTQ